MLETSAAFISNSGFLSKNIHENDMTLGYYKQYTGRHRAMKIAPFFKRRNDK